MGRTLASSVLPTVAVVTPDQPESPSYAKWSYQNAWDPDSDDFFEDAVYEAFLPAEPLPRMDSSDGSSASSSGRGTPTGVPPLLSEDSSNEEFLHWITRMVPDSLLTTRPTPSAPRSRALSDATLPLPAAGAEEAMLAHYAAQYDIVSQSALERMRARQRMRMVAHTAPVGVPIDADSDSEAGDDLVTHEYASPFTSASSAQTRVYTSDITPISLPSSATHAALIAARRERPSTPPRDPVPIPRTPRESEAPDALSLSPPPSVSPRVYTWPTGQRVVHPESPSVQTRARVGPARWPVY